MKYIKKNCIKALNGFVINRVGGIAALFFVHTAVLVGQSSIKGMVVDSHDSPLSYANVLLLDTNDSSLVKGMVTNEKGMYEANNIQPGEYILMASMVGYESKYLSKITIQENPKGDNLRTIQLHEDITELDEATVTAKKPLFEMKLDRLVINVQSSIGSSSANALEVLERSPGVIINRFNKSISLNNKEGVMIMIDGKLNRMPMDAVFEMLNSMSAQQVEKIEIYTNPPAKFDAEGNAGFINIVLNQDENQGFNGTASGTLGYGRKEKAGANGSLNYRNENINIFADYAYFYDVTRQYIDMTRMLEYNNVYYETHSITDRYPTVFTHNVQAGIDYSLTSKTLIGFLGTYFYRDWSQDSYADTRYIINPGNDTLVNGIRDEVNKSNQYMVNANLQHTFRKNHMLNIDLDYFDYYQQQPQTYNNNYLSEDQLIVKDERIEVQKSTPLKIYVGKLDYKLPVTSKISVESGFKATYSTFTNNVSVVRNGREDLSGANDLAEDAEMDEFIGAGYLSWIFSPDDKTNINAGIRYEYNNTELTKNSESPFFRKSHNFFPSLFVSHELVADNTIQLSFGRRITRPSFRDLAPFVIFVDPQTYITGNSQLKPAYITNYKLEYLIRRTMFSLQYSSEKNSISRFQSLTNPETNTTSYNSVNLDRINTVSLTAGIPVVINNWWSMHNNVHLFYNQLESAYGIGQIESNKTSFRLNTTQSFKLPAGFNFELSGMYRTPYMFGVAVMKSTFYVNAAIQKEFKNNFGVLSLHMSDVFNTYEAWRWTTHYPELFLNLSNSWELESRVIKMTYSVQFGNRKLKDHRNRNTGSEEERNRL